MRKKVSLRQLFRSYWIIILSLFVVIFLVARLYITRSLTQYREQEVKDSVSVAGKYTDSSLSVVDSFIYETFMDSVSLFDLHNVTDNVESAQIKREIYNSMASIAGWSDVVNAIVFYAPLSPDQTVLEVGTETDSGSAQMCGSCSHPNLERRFPQGYLTLTAIFL